MWSSRREDNLRAKIFVVIKQFMEPFTVNQFKKAYKKQYDSFPSGVMSAHEHLKTFPELFFDQKKDKFALRRPGVRFSDGSPSVNPSLNESTLHMMALAMATKIGRHGPINGFHFLTCDFVLEWQNIYGQEVVPVENFGYYGLNAFFNKIPSFRRIEQGKYAILGSYNENKANPKKTGEEPPELIQLRQRVVEVARRIISPSLSGASFYGATFVIEWRRLHGPRPVPCYEFGYTSLMSFLDSFDEFSSKRQKTNAAVFKVNETLATPDETDGSSFNQDAEGTTRTYSPDNHCTKRQAIKRSKSPDVIVIDDDEPSRKVPKLEIQEYKVTRLVGEEELNEWEAPVRGGTHYDHSETTMGGGDEGFGQKEHAPVNQMPAPPLQPFFAPSSMYLPSKGEAAGRYITYLLDQAEREGHNVDDIASVAINAINQKIAMKK